MPKTLSDLLQATTLENTDLVHLRQGLIDKKGSLDLLAQHILTGSGFGFSSENIELDTVLVPFLELQKTYWLNTSNSTIALTLPTGEGSTIGAIVTVVNLGSYNGTVVYKPGVFVTLVPGDCAVFQFQPGNTWESLYNSSYHVLSNYLQIGVQGPRLLKEAADLALRNNINTEYADLILRTLKIGDSNHVIEKLSNGQVQIKNSTGGVLLSGTSTQLNGNCWFDGTNWNRMDIAQPACRLAIGSGGWLCYKASAGANPISTWNIANGVSLLLADGSVPMTGVFKQAAGANIVSATTVDLSTATGNSLIITGTTTITSFGTVAAGVMFNLVFQDSLTISHNATSLIIPGGTLTVNPNDSITIKSLGSGNWRVIGYQAADRILPNMYTTGTPTINQWTKLCSISLKVQYADSNVLMQCVGRNSGNPTSSSCLLLFRVRQQSALGNAPVMSLILTDNNGITKDNFKAVMTQNDGTATVIELYYKSPSSFENLSFTSLIKTTSSSGGLSSVTTFYNNQAYLVDLPAGTQTACTYLPVNHDLYINGALVDDVGNELLRFIKTANAVNELTIKSASTGNAVEMQATGDDPNIDVNVVAKGTGKFKSKGVVLTTATEFEAEHNSNGTHMPYFEKAYIASNDLLGSKLEEQTASSSELTKAVAIITVRNAGVYRITCETKSSSLNNVIHGFNLAWYNSVIVGNISITTSDTNYHVQTLDVFLPAGNITLNFTHSGFTAYIKNISICGKVGTPENFSLS